jgi:hypothetical protein
MNKIQEITLALLIIDLGESFANSYKLVNILSRKFHLLNFVDIIRTIEDEQLVNSVYKDGIGKFTITELGHHYLKDNRAELMNMLQTKFPDEVQLIGFQ